MDKNASSFQKLFNIEDRISEIAKRHPFRFINQNTTNVFGNDWFGLKAEGFARFFGTPTFLILQTTIVVLWIAFNLWSATKKFDPYPFILLNLMFSLQAAYAAPLILLAQTRQADRDKVLAESDAQHREALAIEAEQRQHSAADQAQQMMELIRQNNELIALTSQLAERIEQVTIEVRDLVVK